MEATLERKEKIVDFNQKVMEIWNETVKENRDVFTTDVDKIFLAINIAVQCLDIARSEGLLALEKFVDEGCGLAKDEVPLWEYLRTIVWILVDVRGMAADGRIEQWMFVSLYEIWHYNGYQAVQGCIYLIVSFLFLMPAQTVDEMLEYFRSLMPEEAKKAFDIYFADNKNPSREDA